MEAPSSEKKDETGIYIVIENNTKQPKDNYKKKIVKVLAILHLLCGSLSMFCGVVKLLLKTGYQRYEEPFTTAGEGLFLGVLFLITGIIGLLSLRRTNYCKISAFLVLSIFCSLFGVILVIMTFALMHRALYKDYTPAITIHYTLIVIGLIESVLGIVSSSFSCHACCGCCASGPQASGPGNSVVYIPNTTDSDGTKPRVVHLNMADISKIPGTNNAALTDDNDNNEVDGNDKGKYARFN